MYRGVSQHSRWQLSSCSHLRHQVGPRDRSSSRSSNSDHHSYYRADLQLFCVMPLYYNVHAPDAHIGFFLIMYLTVSSSFLVSFVMGGAARAGCLSSLMHLSGPSRVIKFLYSPAPLPPHSMGPRTPYDTPR